MRALQLTRRSVGEAAGVGGLGRRCEVRVLVTALHVDVDVFGMTTATRVGRVMMMRTPPVPE